MHGVPAPAQPELQRLLHTIATRVTRALEKQGPLLRDTETPSLDLEPADGFEQLLGAAVHYRIAVGPSRRTQGAYPVHRRDPRVDARPPASLSSRDFSLHAATRCQAHQRDSLERLCRYIARPALSNERLSVNERGTGRLPTQAPLRWTGPLTSSSTPSTSLPALPRWSHPHAPTSPDTTACSPRTSGTATTSSPHIAHPGRTQASFTHSPT